MTYLFKHVLVPVDFSDDSEQAVVAALAVFGEHAEEITLLTVCEGVSNKTSESLSEIDEMMAKTVDEKMQGFAKKFEGQHLNLKSMIKKGNASAQILNAADEIKSDLIVMGSQGRNSLARVLFGSTTYDVSRKASCSVFVIRG